MNDHWRTIEGYPGYQISRQGEVRSRRVRGNGGKLGDEWHALKPYRRRTGYLTVNLQAAGVKTARYVHHLVLEAFVGPRPPGLICCHDDGDPGNNRLENLRWDSYRSNSGDMLRHGTRPMGSRASAARLTEDEVGEIRRLRSAGSTLADLALTFGVTRQNVGAIVSLRSWRHLP